MGSKHLQLEGNLYSVIWEAGLYLLKAQKMTYFYCSCITFLIFLGKWAHFEQQQRIVPGWSNMKEQHHCSHFTGATTGGSKGSEGTFPAVGERITSWEHRAPVPAAANK